MIDTAKTILRQADGGWIPVAFYIDLAAENKRLAEALRRVVEVVPAAGKDE